MIPFSAIHAKGGESMSPKQKDRTTTNFKNLVFQRVFSIGILLCSKGGESSISKIISKPSWTLKRRISFRGSFCLVKGKAFEAGGENFKSWKCFVKSYSSTFDYVAKGLWKEFTKRICKNKTCGASVVQNVKNKETIHAHLVSNIYWLNSKQPLHLHFAN
jgi:hypothetical protein